MTDTQKLITVAIAAFITILIGCLMANENKKEHMQDLIEENNKNIWGVVQENQARWENLSLRPEYQGPLKDGTFKVAAPGANHVCPCGPPSKRTIDAYGGSHHMLPHMCEPCKPDQFEPVQLGTWWTRKGCGDPSSVGLSQRPYCTDC